MFRGAAGGLAAIHRGVNSRFRFIIPMVEVHIEHGVNYLSGLLSCARVTVLGLSNGLADQRYLHCDKDVAETALIGDCWHIYAHGSGSDRSIMT